MGSKKGTEICSGSGHFELLVTHLGRGARGDKKNAGVGIRWRARREAEVLRWKIAVKAV